MNAIMRGLVRAVAETFTLPGPIVEIGSYQVAGQESVADLRTLFPGRSYLGMDVRPGRGVDLLASVEALPYADNSIGTILAVSTLEHVPRFWRAFDEMHRVLRPDGALLIACPFYFHLHAHPHDYWRFTPEALELLLGPYPSKIVGWHGPRARPANVWGLAFREGRPPISADEFHLYQTRLHHHARMPLPWRRYLRYQLGRLLCGGGPFAPYLERERLDNKCLSSSCPLSVVSENKQSQRLRGSPPLTLFTDNRQKTTARKKVPGDVHTADHRRLCRGGERSADRGQRH